MYRLTLLLIVVSAAFQCGCTLPGWRKPSPFSKRAPCVLQPGATKEHIVQHLNRNITGGETAGGLASWRSTHVRLSLKGMPMTLPASIAVEAPRNFRLRVSEPIGRGEMVDMGSNHQEFWFWAKDGQPHNVISARHEQLSYMQQQLQIPFQPDWLMQVLGVIPIDSQAVTLRHPDPSSSLVELVSTEQSPSGQSITKVIRVDACHGIVREHALHDARGVLIARAALGDHHHDPVAGLVMPRTVQLYWPEMDQQLTLRIEQVELNPPPLPETAWLVPDKPGYPRVDIQHLLAGPAPVRLPADEFGASSPINPFTQVGTEDARPDDFGTTMLSEPGTAGELPPGYSAEAGQSSAVPRPPARALWPPRPH